MSRTASVITIVATIFALSLAFAFTGPGKGIYKPGPLLSGHERFGTACQACHERWSDPSEEKCIVCHQHLKKDDTHSAKAMANPVKAVIPAELEKLGCVSCHMEHMADIISSGYTGPLDFCIGCHPVDKLNLGHKKFGNKSCAESSCHNYHYNLPVEEFKTSSNVRLLPSTIKVVKPEPKERFKATDEVMEAMRGSKFYKSNKIISAQYNLSDHNGTEATCDKCHKTKLGLRTLQPSINVCMSCHEYQTRTFGFGRHGAPSRLKVAPAEDESAQVGCGSCHDVHSLRQENSRYQACVRCHENDHELNYSKSGHSRYLTDPVFNLKPMKGADCATCHMPLMENAQGATMHNESYTSSSRWKMAETVCVRCHGLEFALRGLYDNGMVKHGFTFSPDSTPVGIEYGFRKTDVK